MKHTKTLLYLYFWQWRPQSLTHSVYVSLSASFTLFISSVHTLTHTMYSSHVLQFGYHLLYLRLFFYFFCFTFTSMCLSKQCDFIFFIQFNCYSCTPDMLRNIAFISRKVKKDGESVGDVEEERNYFLMCFQKLIYIWPPRQHIVRVIPTWKSILWKVTSFV